MLLKAISCRFRGCRPLYTVFFRDLPLSRRHACSFPSEGIYSYGKHLDYTFSHCKLGFSQNLLYSTQIHPASTESIEFDNLPFDKEYIRNLKKLGIFNLRLFQYVITRQIVNELGTYNKSESKDYLKLIFYNEVSSGLSVGYLIPLLFLYSLPRYSNGIFTSSITRPNGTLLVLCDSDSICHNISHLILILRPSLRYLVLDSSFLSKKINDKERFCISRKNQNAEHSLLNIVQERFISESKYDIIMVSYNKLKVLVYERHEFLPQILGDVSCVAIDDISKILSSGDAESTVPIKILSEIEKYKARRYLGAKTTNSFHVFYITNSLSREFLDYSKRFLTNFWLYNFNSGTKEKLLYDKMGDVLKLSVDFGDVKKVLALEHKDDSAAQNCNIEHCFCKINKKHTSNRTSVLKDLVYAYLDLPTFSTSLILPPNIKKPIPEKKCIVFVSNRRQLNYLSNLQEFSDTCVCLGRHLDVYERARALANFANGKKPIMFATDASILGCKFDDVAYILNYHPPKTSKSYASRIDMVSKSTNAISITLYDNDQYNIVGQIIKDLKIDVSVHTLPSREYMLKHDLKWLRIFTSQIVDSSRNILLPYLPKAEALIEKYGEGVVNKCIQLILDGKDSQLVTTGREHIQNTSILSGKQGYTAVLLNDLVTRNITGDKGVKAIIERFMPDCKGANIIGSWYKTDTGFVVDISNRHLGGLLDATKDSSEIAVEVATNIPKIILAPRSKKTKKYQSRLPWDATKIRRLTYTNPSTKG